MEQTEVSTVSTTSQGAQLNALELAKENGRLRRENEALSRQRDILKRLLPSVQRTARPEVRDDSISYSLSLSLSVLYGA